MISLRSNITKTILNHFFLEDESLYLNEMVRLFSLDKRNMVKKLRELVAKGILKTEQKGSEIYYSINKQYPLLQEYKKIIFKTYGIENQIKKVLQDIPNVSEIYIFGSYAEGKMDSFSDIDLLIIGDADTININKKISSIQKNINREINATNISKKEFKNRKHRKDPFITQIFKGKTIKIK